jgi:anti-sigma B factor antagonist
MSEGASSPVDRIRWSDRTAIVDVAGEIDLNTSNAFQQELLGVLDKSPTRIVVNLSGVSYMDSSGVASLVKLLSRVRRSSVALRLYGLTDRVRGVFEITRLDSVFDIFGTEEEALA